ncbi:MAG TPA: lytic transglycosylase domain-containing protein [Cytophagaceae bacterium]|jgi:membrane-bound lytic murein transglycosylase D|nr:lytic transglycosylase domain-containing protein [Cytophagaceae bacterium]
MIKSNIWLLIAFFTYACQPKSSSESEVKKINNESKDTVSQCIRSVPIPKQIIFAGDTVPLERTDVREALEAELMVNTFRHSRTLLIIKNVERWRPFVTQVLKDMEIPTDFLYVAVIESEFDNNAISFSGAMGMWQIMKPTARDYNLKINQDVDMRRDPKLSTEAAAKFLKWSNSNLHNWTLTAASYNMGMKGISDRLKEQKVDNFFDLHLNSETARYVYRILAFKLILENPKAYGYFVPENEKYAPYKFTTIIVTENIDNLVDFAKQHNTTYKELRLLNPWFNNTTDFKLRASKNEPYEIRIPE